MITAEEILREVIRRESAISFRDFMETALYHPEAGYYITTSGRIGKKGDYYTASSLGSLFGKMLARQFAEMLQAMGAETLVEMGAGNGTLARDILTEMDTLGVTPRYVIIERSPAMRKTQKEALTPFNVAWHASLSDMPSMEGVFFSNELVDAFPVHLVEMTANGLKEVFVTLNSQGEFTEVLKPLSTPDLAAYFEMQGVQLLNGFRAEVNLDARTWLRTIAEKLKRGFLVTIDYGYPAREMYQDYRRRGTLIAYEGHRAVEDLYHHVGQRDLTAHVNFTALVKWGEQVGLSLTGFTDQAHFLLSLGILESLSEEDTRESLNTRLNAKSLLLPGGMGEMFKVLVQHKGITPPSLTGFKYLPERQSCRI